MAVLAPEAPPQEPALCLAADPFSLAEANINPLTGLSTDYLNHFNEAVMLLEMLPSMPECGEDLAAWRPLTYHEHFERSQLTHRELTIAAYDLADPTVIRQFDAVCRAMRDTVVGAQAALAAQGADRDVIATRAAAQLKSMVALASGVIHGHDIGRSTPASLQAAQAAVDAILSP